ncbi:MAG: transketolase [Treponema sp.]|jgi:transketolase|nr:transketolase [Treponema sp.]
MLQPDQKKELQKMALRLRYDLLEMIGVGVAGHLGGSSSLAELMSFLYFSKMNFSARRLSDPDRDRLVLSKGHAALIQYAALCEKGCFAREELKRVKQLGSLLQGHPDLTIPGIEAVTGSLGQGLSIALGMALGLRLDRSAARVYAIMGDGEQSEGQLWEAAQAAANFKIDNLTAFIDWNKVQATGATRDIFDIPDLDKKWSGFGWNVLCANGHDFDQIAGAVEAAQSHRDQPSVIILDTVKGKCFSFAEGQAAYHNGILTEAVYRQAVRELDAIQAGLQ